MSDPINTLQQLFTIPIDYNISELIQNTPYQTGNSYSINQEEILLYNTQLGYYDEPLSILPYF
jgi:hypothetical protein